MDQALKAYGTTSANWPQPCTSVDTSRLPCLFKVFVSIRNSADDSLMYFVSTLKLLPSDFSSAFRNLLIVLITRGCQRENQMLAHPKTGLPQAHLLLASSFIKHLRGKVDLFRLTSSAFCGGLLRSGHPMPNRWLPIEMRCRQDISSDTSWVLANPPLRGHLLYTVPGLEITALCAYQTNALTRRRQGAL